MIAMVFEGNPTLSVIDHLKQYLQGRRVLLLLDNCEHLLEACALLADQVLRSCSGVRITATSRQALGILCATIYEVPPLSLPEAGHRTGRSLMDSEAVRLLCDRIKAMDPSFNLTDDNAAAVAEVCSRLDGIPRALELAAARAKALSVEQIAQRLGSRFHLLTRGNRLALARHQTLRAAVDWSYQLLSKPEQRLWARLSLFAGSFALDAVEGICSGEGIDRDEMVDLLAQLVDKSIVTVVREGDNRRYRLLETLRAHGAELLAESGSATVWMERYRTWYLMITQLAAAGLNGPDPLSWLGLLDLESENLAAALGYCRGDPDGVGAGLQLCSNLHDYWQIGSSFSFGRQQVTELLSLVPDPSSLDGASGTLRTLGMICRHQGDLALARSAYEQSLDIARQRKVQPDVVASLNGLVGILLDEMQISEALRLAEALELSLKMNDPVGGAQALLGAGKGHFLAGKINESQLCWEEGRAELERKGWVRLAIAGYDNLGILAYHRGEPKKAESLFTKSLALARALEGSFDVLLPIHTLGFLAELRGDFKLARQYFNEGLTLSHAAGVTAHVFSFLEELAHWALRAGAVERAAILLGAADTSHWTRVQANDTLGEHASSMAMIHRVLGDSASDVLARGRAMSLAQAVTYALCEDGQEMAVLEVNTSSEPVLRKDLRANSLTDREREVTRLVAKGLSDRDIAERLYISRYTVSTHMKNIMGKLGLPSRSAVAAWAVRNDK